MKAGNPPIHESLFTETAPGNFRPREDQRALADDQAPDKHLINKETMQALAHSLRLLTPPEREVVLAHQVLGKSYADVARSLGIHKQQAFRIQVAALKKLRLALQPIMNV